MSGQYFEEVFEDGYVLKQDVKQYLLDSTNNHSCNITGYYCLDLYDIMIDKVYNEYEYKHISKVIKSGKWFIWQRYIDLETNPTQSVPSNEDIIKICNMQSSKDSTTKLLGYSMAFQYSMVKSWELHQRIIFCPPHYRYISHIMSLRTYRILHSKLSPYNFGIADYVTNFLNKSL